MKCRSRKKDIVNIFKRGLIMYNRYEQNKEFTESDWKLFRKKIPEWQEGYMETLNEEYMAILSSDKRPSEKFWEIEGRIKRDRRHPGVIIDMRRSTMVSNILRLLADKVIDMDDLEDFSNLLKESIKIYVKISTID